MVRTDFATIHSMAAPPEASKTGLAAAKEAAHQGVLLAPRRRAEGQRVAVQRCGVVIFVLVGHVSLHVHVYIYIYIQHIYIYIKYMCGT